LKIVGRPGRGHRRRDAAFGSGALLSSSSIIDADPGVRRNLIVEGGIDAQVPLHAHGVAIGTTGRVRGDIHAVMIRVEGEVVGDLFAQAQVRVCYLAKVRGNITAPNIIIEEGASFEGQVSMEEPARLLEGSSAAERSSILGA
jgi:cytoskeletal protein CcmA (bactofilin family)